MSAFLGTHLKFNEGQPKWLKYFALTSSAFSFLERSNHLRSGLAKIHIKGPYHEQIVRIVKAPTYLGLPTTFGDKINQYSVTVIEEAEACFIDIDTFRDLLKANHDFSYEICWNYAGMNWKYFTDVLTGLKSKSEGKLQMYYWKCQIEFITLISLQYLLIRKK